jgi:hypothetical protein
MTRQTSNRTRLAAAAIALAGASAMAACSSKAPTVDNGLKLDLAAAQQAARGGQQVVSDIEVSPSAVPRPQSPSRAPEHAPRRETHSAPPAPQVTPAPAAAQPAVVADAPKPAPTPAAQVSPAPAQPAAQQPAIAAPHAPTGPQGRQPGVYTTEGDIFRRMPWIRP